MNNFKDITKILFFTLIIINITCVYANNLDRNFDISSISYELKQEEALPKISDQILFCYNDTGAWLEFTNYEFLINGKESNRLVTVFIGKKENGTIIKKEPIQIFDPELAFVFQDAILQYCSKNSQFDNTLLGLAKIIKVGYDALGYHFDFKNPENAHDAIVSINSPYELNYFIKNTYYPKYKTQAESVNRFVSPEDINSKSELGFIAYYPNPVYNNDDVELSPNENPGFLFDKSTPTENNEFHDILKRIYPVVSTKCPVLSLGSKACLTEKICPKKSSHKTTAYSDLKELTYKNFRPLAPIYLFRGDDRELENVFAAKGFDSPVTRGCHASYGSSLEDLCVKHGLNSKKIEEHRYNTKELMEKIKSVDDFWRLEESSDLGFHTNGAYVSASRNIKIASYFAKNYDDENKKSNVYVFFTKKGIDVPTFLEKEKIVNAYHFETIVPLHVDFTDIAGVRTQDKNKHFIGPVFLKKDFELNNKDNFWEIIQIFGGKNQIEKMSLEKKAQLEKIYNNAQINAFTADNCEKTWQQIYEIKKSISKYMCLDDEAIASSLAFFRALSQ